jgi:hypothetical protein
MCPELFTRYAQAMNMTSIEQAADPAVMSLGRGVQVPILGGDDCDHLIHVAQSENLSSGQSPHRLQQFLFPYLLHHP